MLLFFSVARSQEQGSWERATEEAQVVADKAEKKSDRSADKEKTAKPAAKSAANASFGMNMPMMSSAFDTSMWLSAA